MITFKHRGSFKNTKRFFERAKKAEYLRNLEKYAQEGVNALAAATPVESGETASSWYYEIERTGNSVSIHWANSHVNNNVNIAVILQYGHGTGTSGYVAGRDYINPAIRPVFDRIAENLGREVSNL